MTRPQWLTWGRLVGFAIFGLCLLYPISRMLALAYGVGWLAVECVRYLARSNKPTDEGKG